jgi:hypothetical protein
LFADCVEMNTVVANQDGRRKLPCASGEHQVEGEAGFAGP